MQAAQKRGVELQGMKTETMKAEIFRFQLSSFILSKREAFPASLQRSDTQSLLQHSRSLGLFLSRVPRLQQEWFFFLEDLRLLFDDSF